MVNKYGYARECSNNTDILGSFDSRPLSATSGRYFNCAAAAALPLLRSLVAWPSHPTTPSSEKHSTRYSPGMDNIAQLPVCPAVAVGTDSKSETFAGAFAWWLLLPSVC